MPYSCWQALADHRKQLNRVGIASNLLPYGIHCIYAGTIMLPFVNLKGLLDESPTTKIGQVRAAWPQIRAAVVAGHRLKTIWKRLREDGVDIQYDSFCEYVRRLRQEPICETQLQSAPDQEKGDLNLRTPKHGTRDPAANLRDRLDRPTGFAYRGTQKKEDLE